MRLLTVNIKGTTPYSQSRAFDPDTLPEELRKQPKETHDDYDKRVWREKTTTDENGQIVVPAASFKQAIDSAAKMLSIQIPGKGKATYTKEFVRGIAVFDPLPLGVQKADVPFVRIHANADGIRGSGKRVFRTFPIVPAPWGGTLQVHVISETVPDDVVERVVKASGLFVGVGRFRPENGGTNGRYDVTDFRWSEVA
jgi:hypothetical protein